MTQRSPALRKTKPSLDGSYLKVARARRHLDALHEDLNGILGGESRQVVVTFDPMLQQVILTGRINEPLPARWGPVIGDVLFNLRSALDHAAWSLAALKGPPPELTEFPIFDDADAYFRRDKKNAPVRGSGLFKVRGVATRAQAVIERLQPFASTDWVGPHPGWVLHQLANIDKHRFLHTTDLVVSSARFIFDREVGDVKTIHMRGSEPGFRLVDGAELARFTFVENHTGELKVGVKIETALDVALNEPDALDASLFDFFNAAYNWVTRDVLRRFEDFFD